MLATALSTRVTTGAASTLIIGKHRTLTVQQSLISSFQASRCDGIRHCLDSSDETDCRKIRLPASYKKSVPVPSAKGEQGRAEITANFKIYNILSVDERDSLMRIKFSCVGSF